MSEVRLTADSGGGYVELKAPSTTASNAAKSLVLPNDIGSAHQYLKNGSTAGTLEFGGISGYTIDNSTLIGSNDVHTHTVSLPSNIKSLWMCAYAISNDSSSGNHPFRVRIGDSGGIEGSNYTSSMCTAGSNGASGASSTTEWELGWSTGGGGDTNTFMFHMWPAHPSDDKTWAVRWTAHQHGWTINQIGTGTKVLSGALTQMQLYNEGDHHFDGSGYIRIWWII